MMKPVKNISSATLALAANDVPRAGQVIGDRYRLEQPLERGAMGSVWRAEQIRLRAPVAVKFLEPSLIGDKEMHDRFIQEARSAAAVRSAHVVQVFDYGSDGGVPYIAMELLEGENLDTRLSKGTLTPEGLDKIFSEVARGIGKAHSMGVIHRDLKPGNIFIAREGEHEVTKLVDFGIAKVKADALKFTQNVGTRVGTLLGTPQYMSPEQVRGSSVVDHRTDLWALAIIACECLTGRYPFSGTTIGDLTVQICTEKPMAPSALGEVPPGFDAWFFKATSKKPSKRFDSVQEMAAALHKILGPASASNQAGAWPARLMDLPSRREVRLAYSMIATFPGRLVAGLRPGVVVMQELLQRFGRELARLATAVRSRAQTLAQSEQLAFARPLLSRPRLAASLLMLLSGMVLVGLSSRGSRAPQREVGAQDSAGHLPAAVTAPSALTSPPHPEPGPPAADEPGSSEVLSSALPAPPATVAGAADGDVALAPGLPREPARAERPRSERARAEADKDKEASAPAPKPITLALAKAAAKIMDTDEQTTAASSESAVKAQPRRQDVPARSAVAAKRAAGSPTKPTSGADPFDDRL